MRKNIINQHSQEVLPTFHRSDVFGGSLAYSRISSDWEHDCAAQCILHIMELYGGADYEAVADQLYAKKEWEDCNKRWTFTKKIEWMMSHLGATTYSIYTTLIEITHRDWDLMHIDDCELTLREFSFVNRHIHVMAVGTSNHITPVIDGVVYDAWDSTNRKVSCVIFPYLPYHQMDFVV